MNNVVVTGYGAITPIGNSILEFSKNLYNGASGASTISRFDTTKFATKFACEVKNYTPTDFFEQKEVRKYDLFTQYALVATKEAIEFAGLNDISKIDKHRIGVIAASGVGGIATFQEEMYQYWQHQQPRYFSPYFVTKMIVNNIAGHISMIYGFNGLNFAVASACSSSAHGIISAVQNIQLNKADVIIVTGSEAPIHEAGIGSFSAMRALSTNNQEPTLASRPFDTQRDGFVLGEGAACLILESEAHALKRNAKILAKIDGYAMNADAYHIAKPMPNGEMIAYNIAKCLDDANVQISEIDCVNAHATSTPQGDLAEISALNTVFGDTLKNINITATKSMTGHLLGAAGIMESVASILTIEKQEVPPTINLKNRDEAIAKEINLTENIAQKRDVNYVLNNNFGFGGHNVSILFKKYNV
ncbi:MAG: beta-ketoacyl-ACP synthase II [Sphingobacteriales bacterium]|nr:MAG: beta-ketoacyl-ACP synthase II [Sphingobacteriales bacterium]